MKPPLDYNKIAKVFGVELEDEPELDYNWIAKILGAEIKGRVPATGGYFGAMQLLADIKDRFQNPDGGPVAKHHHEDILEFFDFLVQVLAMHAPLMNDAERTEVVEALDRLRPLVT